MKHEAVTDGATFAPLIKKLFQKQKALLNHGSRFLRIPITLHQVHWYMRGRGLWYIQNNI